MCRQAAAAPLLRACPSMPGTAAHPVRRCAVCRLEFERDDEVRLLPCKHYYHPECVGEWLKHNKTCPVCSKEVVQGKSG